MKVFEEIDIVTINVYQNICFECIRLILKIILQLTSGGSPSSLVCLLQELKLAASG